MSSFDAFFKEKFIKFDNGNKWMRPSKNRGWINSSDISKNYTNDFLFSIFNKNGNNQLDASELSNLFNNLYKFAQSDGNPELSITEIDEFLSKTVSKDNKTLKEMGITIKDIKQFLIQISNITEEKTKVVPKNSKIANQRQDALEQFVNKYNLLNDKSLDSDLFKLAQFVVSEYIKEYGVLCNSTSKSLSILNTTLTDEENEAYTLLRFRPDKLSEDPDIAEAQKKEIMKKYKFANCGELANISASILKELDNGNYEFSKIYFDLVTETGHVAVVVRDPETNESYVIDNWVSPEGGIFKRDDWEKMIKSIYEADNYEISESSLNN